MPICPPPHQDILDLDGDGSLNETEASLSFDTFKDEVFGSIKDKFEVRQPSKAGPQMGRGSPNLHQ